MGTTGKILIGAGLGALAIGAYEVYEILQYRWVIDQSKSTLSVSPLGGVVVVTVTNPSDIEALVIGTGQIFANGVYLSDFSINTYLKGNSSSDIPIDFSNVKININQLLNSIVNPMPVRLLGTYSIALWGSSVLRKNNLSLDYTYNYKI